MNKINPISFYGKNTLYAQLKLSDRDTGKRETIGSVRSPKNFPEPYSLEREMQKCDEFRKSVYREQYIREQNEKRKNNLKSFIKAIAFTTSVYIGISKIKFKKILN